MSKEVVELNYNKKFAELRKLLIEFYFVTIIFKVPEFFETSHTFVNNNMKSEFLKLSLNISINVWK